MPLFFWELNKQCTPWCYNYPNTHFGSSTLIANGLRSLSSCILKIPLIWFSECLINTACDMLAAETTLFLCYWPKWAYNLTFQFFLPPFQEKSSTMQKKISQELSPLMTTTTTMSAVVILIRMLRIILSSALAAILVYILPPMEIEQVGYTHPLHPLVLTREGK